MNPNASSQGTSESGIYSPMRVVSPPRSPTISRRGVNEDGAGQESTMDGAVAQGSSGHGGKSKPELSNLLNLEQALIKTIHGNRKDMPLVPPVSAPQPGTSTTMGEGVTEPSDIYHSDSSVRMPYVGVMSESSFIRGGPTESKSEPLLHHQGQHVVRSRFPVETVACPLAHGSQLGTVSAGSDTLTENAPTESTQIKGRFKVTTTRDSKSQPDVSESDLGVSASTTQDGEDVTNSADSASALSASNSTPSASSNKEDGSQSLPKKPSHVSSGNHCSFVFKLHDPNGRPVNPEVNSLLTQRTNSAACLNALSLAEGTRKTRSASLGQLPPKLCHSNDRLYVYGEGVYANQLGPSLAHAMTQSSPGWWGRSPSPDQADIATQTSPAAHRERLPFDRAKGTRSVVSKGCCHTVFSS